MKQILYIGMNPRTLDFSQPGFPPGLTAEKVEAGIASEIELLKASGFATTMHFIDTSACDLSSLVEQLGSKTYNGILIGAGVRVPPSNFILFEKIINTIHVYAQNSKIIFNTDPTDSKESIKRWL